MLSRAWNKTRARAPAMAPPRRASRSLKLAASCHAGPNIEVALELYSGKRHLNELFISSELSLTWGPMR